MDYEKKYKVALDWMRDVYPTLEGAAKEDAEHYFPELKDKDNDDDRIRKEIIQYIKTGTYHKDWIAWLEKQGAKVSAIEGFKSEFERQVSYLIASAINKEHEYNQGYVKWTANALLNYARYELEKQDEQKPIKEHDICNTCDEKSSCVIPCPVKLIAQKPAGKVEPKFKVGDWIIKDNYSAQQVKELREEAYILDGSISGVETLPKKYIENNYHLWTIQDAKAGDVLTESIKDYTSPFIAIYKERGLDFFNSYCFIGFDGNFYEGEVGHDIKCIHPATEEQRCELMKAMADAGYIFDFESKELKKIELKPADKTVWYDNMDELVADAMIDDIKKSEMPEHCKHNRINWINKHRQKPTDWSKEDEKEVAVLEAYIRSKDWSKRHIDRALGIVEELVNKVKYSRRKPTEEQIDALEHFVRSVGESECASPYDRQTKLLYSLLEQLKQL
jgi:hypothetical protein